MMIMMGVHMETNHESSLVCLMHHCMLYIYNYVYIYMCNMYICTWKCSFIPEVFQPEGSNHFDFMAHPFSRSRSQF